MLKTATRFLFALIPLYASVASAQSIRPGLWEFEQKVGGNPAMDQAMAQMQQQMAAMSPAERKMMQDMLAKQGVSMPGAAAGGGMSVKVCITPDMAARAELPQQTEGECASTVTSRSGNTMKMRFVCKNPPTTGDATYIFTGDTAYTMMMVMKSTHAGKPTTTTMDGKGQWLAAECGSVKPVK